MQEGMENLLTGTQERKVTVERIGQQTVRESGTIKIIEQTEELNAEGTLTRSTVVTFNLLCCGHLRSEIGGVCICGATLCDACSKNLCSICHRPVCGSCLSESFLHEDRKYHRRCRWSIRRIISGR